jgi:hypothetical protein
MFDTEQYPYSLIPFRKAVSLAIDRQKVSRLGEYGYAPPTDAPPPVDGAITEFRLPNPYSSPYRIAAGPDGAMWFTENGANRLGRVRVADGRITKFNLPAFDSGPTGIVAGPGGTLWFGLFNTAQIGTVVLAAAEPTRTATPTDVPSTTPTSTAAPVLTATITATAPPVLTATVTMTVPPGSTATATMANPFTPTATATGATEPSLTATPASTPTGPIAGCAGDCNSDLHVSIGELVTAVNIALDRADLATCRPVDTDHDGSVRVNELVAAVRSALIGCP